MIYVLMVLYFLCGLGVTTASEPKGWIEFLLSLIFWPMVFMYALCLKLKERK